MAGGQRPGRANYALPIHLLQVNIKALGSTQVLSLILIGRVLRLKLGRDMLVELK